MHLDKYVIGHSTSNSSNQFLTFAAYFFCYKAEVFNVITSVSDTLQRKKHIENEDNTGPW